MDKLLLIGVAVLLVCAVCTYGYLSLPTKEEGSITITFCPECGKVFTQTINNTVGTECALYGFSAENAKLLEENDVAVLTDWEDGGPYGQKVRVPGLMHHKFCVINDSIVLSGSYNPTRNGVHSKNNLVTIESATLARAYEREHSLVGGKWKPWVRQRAVLSGTPVQVWFCPRDGCEDALVQSIEGAQSNVTYLVYSFTSDAVREALQNAQERGVTVTGVCDRSQWNVRGGECATLDALRWEGTHLLHHKVFIIDDRVTFTGSYNPTANGNTRNSENLLRIESEAVALRYLAEYRTVAAASAPVN